MPPATPAAVANKNSKTVKGRYFLLVLALVAVLSVVAYKTHGPTTNFQGFSASTPSGSSSGSSGVILPDLGAAGSKIIGLGAVGTGGDGSTRRNIRLHRMPSTPGMKKQKDLIRAPRPTPAPEGPTPMPRAPPVVQYEEIEVKVEPVNVEEVHDWSANDKAHCPFNLTEYEIMNPVRMSRPQQQLVSVSGYYPPIAHVENDEEIAAKQEMFIVAGGQESNDEQKSGLLHEVEKRYAEAKKARMGATTDEPSRKIPNTIVMTSPSDQVPISLARNIQKMRKMNPQYALRHFSDLHARAFIKRHCAAAVLAAFDALVPGAFKADLFRYAYLYENGGVYVDADQVAVSPLNDFIMASDEFVSAIDQGGKDYLYNAFIAVTPKHPVIAATLDKVVHNVENRHYGRDVLDITGPQMFGDVFRDIFKINGTNGLKMGPFNSHGRLYIHKRRVLCAAGTIEHYDDDPETARAARARQLNEITEAKTNPRRDGLSHEVLFPDPPGTGKILFWSRFPEYKSAMKWYTRQVNYWDLWRQGQVYRDPSASTIGEEKADKRSAIAPPGTVLEVAKNGCYMGMGIDSDENLYVPKYERTVTDMLPLHHRTVAASNGNSNGNGGGNNNNGGSGGNSVIIPGESQVSKIPKTLVQCHLEDQIPTAMASAMQSVMDSNPDFEHRYFSLRRAKKFVAEFCGKTAIDAFNSIRAFQSKFDIFRYCYLYHKGGVFLHSSLAPAIAASGSLNHYFTLHNTSQFFVAASLDKQLSNLFIATVPSNPAMYKALEISIKNVEEQRSVMPARPPSRMSDQVAKAGGPDAYRFNPAVITKVRAQLASRVHGGVGGNDLLTGSGVLTQAVKKTTDKRFFIPFTTLNDQHKTRVMAFKQPEHCAAGGVVDESYHVAGRSGEMSVHVTTLFWSMYKGYKHDMSWFDGPNAVELAGVGQLYATKKTAGAPEGNGDSGDAAPAATDDSNADGSNLIAASNRTIKRKASSIVENADSAL